MNGTRGAARAIAWGLVVLSALTLLIFVGVYAVNGPEWDYTTVSEVFYRWDQGRFTFEYLFRQHNEHRIAVPRLVILALGLLTRWKNPPEMYAHWALMCATAMVVYGAFRRELEDRTRAVLLFVPMMLILLSPRSYDALLGFGFPHYLSILFLVAALRILAFNGATWASTMGAVACGLIASFSMSNGLLVWPFGLALLIADVRLPARTSSPWPRIVLWTIAGALTFAFYFHGYTDPGNHTSPWIFVAHPTRGVGHFLAVNGSVLAPNAEDAIVIGAILVAFYAALIVATIADWWRRGERPPFGFWLVTIVLLSAAMISANRAGLGIRQAVSSRYTAMLALAPVGLYWALIARARRWPLAGPLAVSVATLMILGYLLAWSDALRAAPHYASQRRWMAYMMYSAKYQPSSLLEKLYANPDHARIYSAELERMRYNVFADPHILPAGLEPSTVQPEYKVETINGLPPGPTTTIDVGSDGAVEAVGYAMNDSGTGAARAVFLTIDGTRQLPAASGLFRDTLGGPIRGHGRRWTVFDGSFGGFVLTPGEHTLAVTIVHDDGRHAYVTPIIASIRRR
jgi:hypothetical protein